MTQPQPSPNTDHRTTILRVIASIFFIAAGVNHFLNPSFYRSIVPPMFPAPGALVVISGVAEIVGGAGLLFRPLRRIAGWGLIALLIAVFPANLYMALSPEKIPDLSLPPWTLWARLPFQFVFIAWVWRVSSLGSFDQIRWADKSM